MTALASTVLETSALFLLRRIRPYRAASHQDGLQTQLERVLKAVTRDHGFIVQGGPFRGMKYVDRTSWSRLPPKLLGVYERELASVVGNLLATHEITVIPAVKAGAELAARLDLSSEDRIFAVSEFRPAGMEWAPMSARRSGQG